MADIAALGLEIRFEDVDRASASLDKLAGSAKGAEVDAKKFAAALKQTGGDVKKITPQMLGLASATKTMSTGATASARRMIAANDNIARSVNRLGGVYRRVAGIITGLFAGALAAVSLKVFIKATIEANQVQAQLGAALKSTGGAAGRSIGQLNAHAAALQKVTNFGDEAINSAQGILLTFTRIRGDQFDKVTEAVLNVATAMKTDLKSAAIQVGKALNDPNEGMTALTRSGITFTEAQKEMVKQLVASGDMVGAQTLILKELETQFGGSAKAARDTLGGALESLRNAWGDLFELGREKSEVLRQAIERLITAITDPAFVNLVQTIGVQMVRAFASLIEKVSDLVQGSDLNEFVRNAVSLATQAAGAIRGMTAEITGLAEAISLIGEGEFRKARDAWNAGQAEFLRIQAETKSAVDAIWAEPAPGTALGANKVDLGWPGVPAAPPAADETPVDQEAIKKAAESYAKLLEGAQKFIAEQELERRALGMTSEAANQLRYEFDLMNRAQEAGIKLTGAQREELSGLASAMAAAEANTSALTAISDAAKDALQSVQDMTRGFLGDVVDGFKAGASAADTFRKALVGVLDKLSNMGLDMVTTPMFGEVGTLNLERKPA